ncbi:MAG: hypothetical protein CMM49_05625 [Rhodospirillaceae bacterium]|nr:hypothetical protein [Rhodospirillaceae bacterium]|tara:strand:- start:149 stop:403 length:255 start_codon:yes stop_codon:yes gene_type:complete
MSNKDEKAVNNVTVELSVVLGRSDMPIHQLLKMGRGAVIELDTTVDDPALIMANDRLIAEGEVMVSKENVAVTISKIIGKLEDV